MPYFQNYKPPTLGLGELVPLGLEADSMEYNPEYNPKGPRTQTIGL